MRRAIVNSDKTSSEKAFLNFSPFDFSSIKLGMNAALNVPSANNLLKVFGKRNATKKASASIDAPRKTAIKMSLA